MRIVGRILAAVALVTCLSTPAFSQAQTRVSLTSQAIACVFQNTTGKISGTCLQAVLLAIINSTATLLDAQTFSGQQTFLTAPVIMAPASGSAQSTTATCAAANSTVALAGAIDFVNGQGISLEHCGATFSGAAPTGLTVSATGQTQQGPTGATSVSYQVACVDDNGGVGIATTAVTIANSNAVLGTVTQSTRNLAYNSVTWTNGGACAGVAVWRNIASAGYHLIGVFGITGGFALNDIDDSGVPQVVIPWIPDTPTVAALNDRLVTTISSGAGTTSIVVASAPANSLAGAYTRHDDTLALNSLLSASKTTTLAPGTYNVEGFTIPSTVTALRGSGMGATIIQGWNGLAAAVTATTMPKGFTLSDLQIIPLSGGNAVGLAVDHCTDCQIHDLALSGAIPMQSISNTACFIHELVINNWYRIAIYDASSSRSEIYNNHIYAGLETKQGFGVWSNGALNSEIHDNRVDGGTQWAYYSQFGNIVVIRNNKATNSLAESYHIGNNSVNVSILDNTAYPLTKGNDYCISVSDDNLASGISNVVIKGNLLVNCGINAIGIAAYLSTGAGTDIGLTVITDNIIENSNADAQAGGSDIVLDGSAVHGTMISGNTFLSGSSRVTYAIRETNTYPSLSYPLNTQVGANFGLPGSTGYTDLHGAGSNKLTAGTTGLP